MARKYTRQISIKLTPEEARVLRELCTSGEFHCSAGQLFRRLLSAEAKRRLIVKLGAS